MIPFLDLAAQHRALAPEIEAAVREIFATTAFVQGERVRAFEQAFAEHCGVDHGVAVASGTHALELALRALGAGPGDEVVTTPSTFFATAEAILAVGATPRFADVDPETLQLDPRAAEAAVGPRTVGLLPVHLFGTPADLDGLRALAERRGLWLVEDACQAHGARWRGARAGSVGNAGCFSFYPGKNLGTCGEGGMIVTRDADLAAHARLLRDHGSIAKYEHVAVGTNGRMSELEAAVLSIKLPHLDGWNESRRRIAAWYREALADLPLTVPAVTPGAESVHHLFPILAQDRDRLRAALDERGIGTGLHYPRPLHLQPALTALDHAPGDFPHAERAARHLLSLPMFPELAREQVDAVAGALRAATSAAVA